MNKIHSVFIIILLAILMGHSIQADALVEVAPGESITFSKPDDGRDKKSPPVAGTAFAQEEHANSKLRIGSLIIGSTADDNGYARATLFSEFRVVGDEPRNLKATVTGNVSWNGFLLTVIGNQSSYSRISITASLWDLTEDSLAGSVSVLKEQCDGKFTEACLITPSTNKDLTYSATVTMGHEYELRLSAQCTTAAGLAGFDVTCDFYDAGGYVKWNGFRVTVEDDLVGLIKDLKNDHGILAGQHRGLDNDHFVLGSMLDELEAGQDELKAGQEALKAGQEALKASQEEIIQLLNTPEGKRSDWNKNE